MFVTKPDGTYYKIENINNMQPFFITLASASDTWVYLSSGGSLTAGRKNPAGCIFPYETEDRLHASVSTGPKTIVRLTDGRVWEPFDKGYDNPFSISRNIYKRVTGDALIYEEINNTLEMTFSYRWETCQKYGLVRTSKIENNSTGAMQISILDGVENIVPYDVDPNLARDSSCLTDAYKASERFGDKMAVYSLTSLIVDLPEPVEVLRANAAWYAGKADSVLLSSKQIAAFAAGEIPQDESRVAGIKGAFLLCKQIRLNPGESDSLIIVLDAQLSQKQLCILADEINSNDNAAMREMVENEIRKSTDELVKIVAVADGMQLTADTNGCVRHYMNVLYNNMRGGVFLDGYRFNARLFEDFVNIRNKELYRRSRETLAGLCKNGDILELHEMAYRTGELDIIRMSMEFLPLTFSRRHGDPSRPWNTFNIFVKDEHGNRVYGYEGNWRDIFQNWEALALSFPGYIAPIITKFLNASTADGFNPYRINQDGVDWEIPEPENPFSGYGYWGDHQIVYLTRLLEWLELYSPEDLQKLIKYDAFTFSDVPYEIKPYSLIVKNSKDTIVFNEEKHNEIICRSQSAGTDGKLLQINAGEDSGKTDSLNLYHASFFEKLIVPILSKISNFVPCGGIWMNTHRPEWNDGNNAIVGNGLSMVTVYQLYRHLKCCCRLIDSVKADKKILFSTETAKWFDDILELLGNMNNLSPRAYLDAAGSAFERYREKLYRSGLSGKTAVEIQTIKSFLLRACDIIEETIRVNKRDDGMYQSYNILTLTEGSLEISPLFLMLEGQTAILGSGFLSNNEAAQLIETMESSALLSDEHNAFYLYPKKQLKAFVERNIIPPNTAESSRLIKRLLNDADETLVLRDASGNVRFSDTIRQHSDMTQRLNALKENTEYYQLVCSETELLDDIYEQVFGHKQFTGRSGIMYKYEGIGSIYWHQNSKFQLSLQETITKSVNKAASQNDREINGKLIDAYYRLQDGFGFRKDARKWGAFPLEPYSHCPYNMPAQQPGMTGQVKEDILTRNTELGIMIKDGILSFNPFMLKSSQFLAEPSALRYVTSDGTFKDIKAQAGSLVFTVCCVPVIYKRSDRKSLTVYDTGGRGCYNSQELSLDENISRRIFNRDGTIGRIEVEVCADL